MPRKVRIKTTVQVAGEEPIDVTDAMEAVGNHDRIRGFVDRLVRLTEEKAEVATQIKEVCKEADGSGYSSKAIMILVKREMETAEKRVERLEVAEQVELMERALGLFAGTPLGRSAVERASAVQ